MNSVASSCKVSPVRQGTGKKDYVRNDFKNRKRFVWFGLGDILGAVGARTHARGRQMGQLRTAAVANGLEVQVTFGAAVLAKPLASGGELLLAQGSQQLHLLPDVAAHGRQPFIRGLTEDAVVSDADLPVDLVHGLLFLGDLVAQLGGVHDAGSLIGDGAAGLVKGLGKD